MTRARHPVTILTWPKVTADTTEIVMRETVTLHRPDGLLSREDLEVLANPDGHSAEALDDARARLRFALGGTR